MSLLLDLALTPEVFGATGYSTPERSDDCLFQLEPIVMQEAIVRDLAGGRWQECLSASEAALSVAGSKLFRAMADRIRSCPAVKYPNPETPDEWCWEAQPAFLTNSWSLPPADPLGGPEMRAKRNPRHMEVTANR